MGPDIERLISIIEDLLGPEGCPWDREQTMKSIRSSVLEEACEFIDAIDLGDNHHMVEELGDLFFNVIFFCKLGEKENRFTLKEVVAEISEKLIRRHPHVFGAGEVNNAEEVVVQWEKIKQLEKGKEKRKDIFDGIPKHLPALLRAQKILKKLPAETLPQPYKEVSSIFQDEDSLGILLAQIAVQAQLKGLDAEQALRNYLAQLESKFRNGTSS